MSNRPIIVIKKKGGHAGHHGGAWKVAYADFVTAMMALFIVLWLLNSSKKIQEAIGGYFKDPAGSAQKVGTDMQGSAQNFVLKKDDMPKLKEELEKALKQVPDFEKLKNHIDMTVTNEGLRIELTEGAKGTFFDSGSAKLSPDGQEILEALAAQLGTLPNKIYCEGHTDAKPYAAGNNYTNWELSADRANAARRLLQEHGVGPEQVTQVRGFSDMNLRDKLNPLDPANRRISLIVQYMDKSAASDAGADGGAAGSSETGGDAAKPGDTKAPQGAADKPQPGAAKAAEGKPAEPTTPAPK